jgi:2-polyprenyl-6-methoxyphenol hydroxylase-like FAD-dependent oxidoreductase
LEGLKELPSWKCILVMPRRPSRAHMLDWRLCSAGDAAHSFPPTGGLGLCSGLGDVHNLAHKLVAIHQGWGSSSLLGTYRSERRHVAVVNSLQSVKNGRKIFRLLKTLGTTDSNVAQARKNLFRTISDPNTKRKCCVPPRIRENILTILARILGISIAILRSRQTLPYTSPHL